MQTNHFTRILPTDKRGNIYYGARTFAEAEKKIADARDQGNHIAPQVADNMEAAGYKKIAARIRKEYL